MFKTSLAIAFLGLTSLGIQRSAEPETLPLKEEEMRVEFTATSGEVTLIVAAESETSLGSVEVRSPNGGPLLRLASGDRALQGFVIETMEIGPEEFFTTYREGTYDLEARTLDGRIAKGEARLAHDLPRVPLVLSPLEGAMNVPLNPVITWVPDPEAAGYQIVLEQGENDGLTATLPAGSSSFQVPYGILESGMDSHFEVGAIGENGNCTLVEVNFTTL